MEGLGGHNTKFEQLVKEKITGGCGGGNYCPESPVTRDQMGVFIARTFDLWLE